MIKQMNNGRIRMSLFFLTLFLLFANTHGHGQITWDTTQIISRHEGGYGKFKPSMKVSGFYTEGVGCEIVRVRNSLSLAWLTNNTSTKYYGLQWTDNKNYKYGLTGLKAGGEVDFRFLHLGFAMLSQTDFEKFKFYIAPEVGLSWWGTIGMYYCVMISLNNYDFEGIPDYQLGLKYNFTKDLAKEFRDGTF